MPFGPEYDAARVRSEMGARPGLAEFAGRVSTPPVEQGMEADMAVVAL